MLTNLDSQRGGFCNSECQVCLRDSSLVLSDASIDSAVISKVDVLTDRLPPPLPPRWPGDVFDGEVVPGPVPHDVDPVVVVEDAAWSDPVSFASSTRELTGEGGGGGEGNWRLLLQYRETGGAQYLCRSSHSQ